MSPQALQMIMYRIAALGPTAQALLSKAPQALKSAPKVAAAVKAAPQVAKSSPRIAAAAKAASLAMTAPKVVKVAKAAKIAKGAKASGAAIKAAKAAAVAAKAAGTATAGVGAASKIAGAAKFAGSKAVRILPWALLFGGRTLQGASTAAGSLLAGGGGAAGHAADAVGQIPRHLGTASQAQIDRFGKTPMATVGDIVGGLGTAAGRGLMSAGQGVGNAASSIGNAVGSSVTDMSESMRLSSLQEKLNARRLEEAVKWQDLNLSPSTAKVVTQSMVGQR